jgi:hypothetical protein
VWVLFADGFLGFLLIGLWVFCIFDVITTPEHLVKHLPKVMWLIIVLILPDIGSISWLVAGRERNLGRATASSRPSAFAEYDRPGRATAASPGGRRGLPPPAARACGAAAARPRDEACRRTPGGAGGAAATA